MSYYQSSSDEGFASSVSSLAALQNGIALLRLNEGQNVVDMFDNVDSFFDDNSYPHSDHDNSSLSRHIEDTLRFELDQDAIEWLRRVYGPRRLQQGHGVWYRGQTRQYHIRHGVEVEQNASFYVWRTQPLNRRAVRQEEQGYFCVSTRPSVTFRVRAAAEPFVLRRLSLPEFPSLGDMIYSPVARHVSLPLPRPYSTQELYTLGRTQPMDDCMPGAIVGG